MVSRSRKLFAIPKARCGAAVDIATQTSAVSRRSIHKVLAQGTLLPKIFLYRRTTRTVEGQAFRHGSATDVAIRPNADRSRRTCLSLAGTVFLCRGRNPRSDVYALGTIVYESGR